MKRTDGTVSRILRAQPVLRFPVRSSVPLTRDIPLEHTPIAGASPNDSSPVCVLSLRFPHERESLAVTASSYLVATAFSVPR
jgi:hypothetical protein